jgi:hypothetical protein
MELTYFIIYLGDNRILWQGSREYCKRIFKAYEGMTDYVLVNQHQLRQLTWDF